MKKAKHPKGLYILFFTEMWERFSYYLMIGILTLYMIDTETGGLGLSKAEASEIYGSYIALVYLTPFLGGLAADRWLGYRRAIVLGGLLMMVGHALLAVEGMGFFYSALAFLIVGNGFFKANISTMVGNLYAPGDPLRDAGFSIFYMGINIGAFVCNFVAAILRNNYGWHAAFGSAGIGMAIGTLIFALNYRKFAHADRKAELAVKPKIEGLAKLFSLAILPGLATGAIGFWLGGPTVAFFTALVPVIAFYIGVLVRSPAAERHRIGALLAFFAAAVFFWMVFHQNGAALTFWAEDQTDRRVDRFSEKVVSALRMEEEATPLYFVNASPDTPRPTRGALRIVSAEEYKLATESRKVMAAYKARGEIPVTADLAEKIYRNARPDTPLIPKGDRLPLWSTELFQSINPFFIIVLTPAVVLLWAGLRRKRKEPSTPGKAVLGLSITAFAAALMAMAVHQGGFGALKVSAWWLIGTYFFVTIGELLLSPVGLSLVTKLAPARVAGLMMGGWFLAISAGNKLAGFMSGLWDELRHDTFFLLLGGGAALAAVAVLVMLPWLKRVMSEHP